MSVQLTKVLQVRFGQGGSSVCGVEQPVGAAPGARNDDTVKDHRELASARLAVSIQG